MNLSDYIKELQKLESEYGDDPVLLIDTSTNTYHEASTRGIHATKYTQYYDHLGLVKSSSAVALTFQE